MKRAKPRAALVNFPSSRRLEHDFFTAIELLVEKVVALGSFGEWELMSNDEAGIDLAALDPFQERLHVAVCVALPRAQRQGAVDHCTNRKLVDEAAVYHR